MKQEEIKELKRKLEADIACAVSKLTREFNEQTGFQISSVGIEISEIKTVGKEDEYVVTDAFAGIGI